MRRVKCYECGRRYDFDVDDFCPGCGAFNQPPRTSRIDANGQVIRVDGLDERNHQDSFVHAELHQEERQRRRTELAQSVRRTAERPVIRTTPQRTQTKKKKGPFRIIGWIVLAVFLLNFLEALINIIF